MSKQIQDAYIVAAVRTPVGKAPRGMFRNTRPDDLLAFVLRGALAKVPSLDPKAIGDVIVGCAIPEAEQGMNVARIGLLLAGIPNTVPGVTVNRFCASGLTAVAMAADRIHTGAEDVMIAAGTETMSLIPMGGQKLAINHSVFAKDENYGMAYGMGLTAEKVAEKWKVGRETQDEFALASHKKAIAATESGQFKDEILLYEIDESFPDLNSGQVVHKKRIADKDEGPRADSTLEGLAKLRPVFAAKGSVTAGNSSQTSDGAGAVILVSEKALKQYGLIPLAKFVGFSVAGVPPEIMGIGPAAAIPKVLAQTGLKLSDMGWIELNEAFAAQSLAVMQELDMDPAVINPLGGAIALGHPLGATGAIRSATVVHGLRRSKQKYGMVTMCIGTGMGAAGVFEAV
ncbi:MAG: acetyl-CoA C-acyltransferase [Burkholderiales bacterium]